MYEVYEANIHTVHTGQDGWLSGHWKWRFRVIFGEEKKKQHTGKAETHETPRLRPSKTPTHPPTTGVAMELEWSGRFVANEQIVRNREGNPIRLAACRHTPFSPLPLFITLFPSTLTVCVVLLCHAFSYR